MPSSHKSFATQLNKLHGSSVHLNRGNSHGDSLYNIFSQYFRELYKLYSNNLESPITQLHYSSTLLVSDLISYYFSLSSLSQAIPMHHPSHFLFKSFELISNEFEFNFNRVPTSILRDQAHFCKSGESIPMCKILP